MENNCQLFFSACLNLNRIMLKLNFVSNVCFFFIKGFAIWKVPEASGNCYLKGALAPSQNDCLMLSASKAKRPTFLINAMKRNTMKCNARWNDLRWKVRRWNDFAMKHLQRNVRRQNVIRWIDRAPILRFYRRPFFWNC